MKTTVCNLWFLPVIQKNKVLMSENTLVYVAGLHMGVRPQEIGRIYDFVNMFNSVNDL